jgi:hypothetical protein
LLGIAATAVLAASACGQQEPVLRVAGADPPVPFGIDIVAPSAGALVSVGSVNMCVDHGTARVTRVRFQDGNVTVEGYGVRSLKARDTGLGSAPGPLRRNGFPATVALVTARCDERSGSAGGDWTELGITLRSDPRRVVNGDGLVVEYSTAAGESSLRVPFEVEICPPADPARCQRAGTS